ncbi:hypothetical protein [Jatrophihabitans fulvus]
MSSLHRARLRALVALIVTAVLGVGVFTAASPASAYTSTTDLVYVHGYGGCNDVLVTGAGPLQTQYYFQNQPADKLHAVAFYGCDTNGDRIVGYGPRNKQYFPSPDNDGLDTDIRHVGYELAWYLYDRFTAKGLPVNLVGGSMGGLIIAFAMQRVKARDPLFPPRLAVRTALTFSTPFGGVDLPCTPATVQCTQIQKGSPFIKQVIAGGAAQVGSGTFWVVIGSTGCDFVPPSSSEALPGAVWAVDYTFPCYDHNGYVWDSSAATDATGTLNGSPFTGGVHSLALMQWALQ